jgi:hypothetical protein
MWILHSHAHLQAEQRRLAEEIVASDDEHTEPLLQAAFRAYDVHTSGTIDHYEAKRLLYNMFRRASALALDDSVDLWVALSLSVGCWRAQC